MHVCLAQYGVMAKTYKQRSREIVKKITIMSCIFQQRPVIDTDVDTIVNAGVLSKTWLGLFQIR